MAEIKIPLTTDNPFASHRMRPGALPFLFPAGTSAESLVIQFAENDWRGQCVGPHGSGKSTLLAALLPVLKSRGVSPRAIALRDGQRRLPADLLSPSSSKEQLVLVVDGYEQLSLFSKLLLRWRCWRRGWGLLITTHAHAVRLPVLIVLAPTLELLDRLHDRLLSRSANDDEHALAELSFHRHGGNLREVWFDLYDRHERLNRPVECCHDPGAGCQKAT
jgi:hypothetical protein